MQNVRICAKDILYLYEETLASENKEFAIRIGELGVRGGDAYPLSNPGYFMPKQIERIIWPNDIGADEVQNIRDTLAKYKLDKDPVEYIRLLDGLMRKKGSIGVIAANADTIASRMQRFLEEVVDQWVLNPHETADQPVLILKNMRRSGQYPAEYDFGDISISKFGNGAANNENIHTKIGTNEKSRDQIVNDIVTTIKSLRKTAKDHVSQQNSESGRSEFFTKMVTKKNGPDDTGPRRN